VLISGYIETTIFKTEVRFTVYAIYDSVTSNRNIRRGTLEYWMAYYGTAKKRSRYSKRLIKEVKKITTSMGFIFKEVLDVSCIDAGDPMTVKVNVLMDITNIDLYKNHTMRFPY